MRWLPLFALMLAACGRETVAHRQAEREANRILVVLAEHGVSATKVRDPEARELRFDVMVAGGDAPRALAALERRNLPRSDYPSSRDLIASGGMIPTEHEERMRTAVGLEGDIVDALRELPGVVEVRAAISVSDADPLARAADRPPPKASVLVVHASERRPSRADIQRFVQAKLPSISAEAVDVVFVAQPASRPISVEQSCAVESALGFRLCAGEASRLYAAAGSAASAALGLFLSTVWMASRSGRARRRGDAAA